VARTGASEFAVLLPGHGDARVLARIARRVGAALARPLELGGREFYLNASFGIAVHPQDGNRPATLLRNARAAQRKASEAGWYSHMFFSEALAGDAMERLVLQSELRRAIGAGELYVVYQPQVDAASGAAVGLECLVRWRHPTRGVVSPGLFVPVAEESGLVAEMGAWVLEAACRQVAAWDAAGLPPVRVAVNVSAVEMKSPRYVDRVRGILAETGVDPARLELELTESALAPAPEAENGHDVLARLEALRGLGLHLAVDDFGTGYSCLRYLKSYPIDRLKIDQSFVGGLPADENDVAISAAVIALGRSMGMEVVAEGVETEAQAAHLRAAGCHVLQGFLYGRPLDVANVPAALG
jgi:EAL domain-containing protein (putative c-di-GMP-specific phosphodiesterase class I)